MSSLGSGALLGQPNLWLQVLQREGYAVVLVEVCGSLLPIGYILYSSRLRIPRFDILKVGRTPILPLLRFPILFFELPQ